MRRRPEQEREETDAREQAEARRLALLADLKAREVALRTPDPELTEAAAEATEPAEPAAESAPEQLDPPDPA